MSDEFREVFQEVTSNEVDLYELHPQRLDRWWKTMVGAPGPIYMQLGCHTIFQQVRKAATAVKQMAELLGLANIPVSPQELAQRHIKDFTWHVEVGPGQAQEKPGRTLQFGASWNTDTSSWRLSCEQAPTSSKLVASLEQAVEKAREWASQLDGQLREDIVKSEQMMG